MNELLSLFPVLRRFAYLRRLFDWLEESLEASRHSTASGYPEIPPRLLASLENMGDEIASVTLLKYCEKLRNLNEQISAIKGPGPNADALALDVQLEQLPNIKDQYEIVRRDCLNAVFAWLVIPVVIGLVIALRSCCS